MRNVLTAGENSPPAMDHFPASRASRWKNQVAEGPVYEGSNTNDNIERGLDPLVAGDTRHEKKQ